MGQVRSVDPASCIAIVRSGTSSDHRLRDRDGRVSPSSRWCSCRSATISRRSRWGSATSPSSWAPPRSEGSVPGSSASVLGFLTFNFVFLPPYYVFAIERPEHIVVLFVFLGLSILIATLLARVADRADAAESRGVELSILQGLSAQLTAVVPGPETYRADLDRASSRRSASRRARSSCRRPMSESSRRRRSSAPSRARLALRGDPTAARTEERLPLSVGGRNLGLLVLRSDRAPLTPPETRVLRAFCDQFALVLERDRLLRAATETEVLRQTDRTRRALLDAVSHDLRSPLAAIKASVTDLLGTEAEHGLAETKEALESIDAETDRLTGLIANLLDMSRIEQGAIVPQTPRGDLGEAIDAALDRTRHLARDLRFTLRVIGRSDARSGGSRVPRTGAREPPRQRGEGVLGRGGLGAATPRRGADRDRRPRRRGHGPRCGSSTTGPASLRDARELLFYPFYQLSDRHPRHGTGLGLAICRGFLSLMDGEIWIEETPGGGATFAFSLPTAETGG